MDIHRKIWLKGLAADYKKDAEARGVAIDKEHEDAFMKLLKDINYDNQNQKKK